MQLKALLPIVLGILAFSTLVNAQTIHVAHCLAGCPVGTPARNELVLRNLFAVSVNQQTGVADWVSYRILKDTVGVASLLPRDWQADDLLQGGIRLEALSGAEASLRQPNLENQQDRDYRLTEVLINPGDQGHLVPLSSFAGTSYWPDLNLLSVMSLLKSDMRLGPWSRLDQAINGLAQAQGEIFVLVGPVYSLNQTTNRVLADEDGIIPEAFFKIVANQAGEMSVFLFDQNLLQHANYCQMSELTEIESATGLDLFPQSPQWPTGSLDQQLGCIQ